jgi:hypothetical protein
MNTGISVKFCYPLLQHNYTLHIPFLKNSNFPLPFNKSTKKIKDRQTGRVSFQTVATGEGGEMQTEGAFVDG